jgi:hypothetical protein
MKACSIVILAAVMIFAAASCMPVSQEPAGSATAPAVLLSSLPTATPAPENTPTQQPTDTTPKDYSQIGFDLMLAESIGAVQLNMAETQLIEEIGQPESKSEPEVWGADGLEHSDWTYSAIGLSINLSGEADLDEELSVFSITALPPCDQETQRGIGIGASRQEVLAAYGEAIENQDDPEALIAGTAFGGIVFHFKDGVVDYIFIGASAE